MGILRSPPGGGVWSKVLPARVACKVELARRWLALHQSFLTNAATQRARLEENQPSEASIGIAGPTAPGDGNTDAASFGSMRSSNAAGQLSIVRTSTVASGEEMLRSAVQLKMRLAMDLRRLGDLFHTWDLDGDGQMDRREFRAAVRSLGIDELEQVCDVVFNEFDEDGSGGVDYGKCTRRRKRRAR